MSPARIAARRRSAIWARKVALGTGPRPSSGVERSERAKSLLNLADRRLLTIFNVCQHRTTRADYSDIAELWKVQRSCFCFCPGKVRSRGVVLCAVPFGRQFIGCVWVSFSTERTTYAIDRKWSKLTDQPPRLSASREFAERSGKLNLTDLELVALRKEIVAFGHLQELLVGNLHDWEGHVENDLNSYSKADMVDLTPFAGSQPEVLAGWSPNH